MTSDELRKVINLLNDVSIDVLEYRNTRRHIDFNNILDVTEALVIVIELFSRNEVINIKEKEALNRELSKVSSLGEEREEDNKVPPTLLSLICAPLQGVITRLYVFIFERLENEDLGDIDYKLDSDIITAMTNVAQSGYSI